jgi:hypothetical protein
MILVFDGVDSRVAPLAPEFSGQVAGALAVHCRVVVSNWRCFSV